MEQYLRAYCNHRQDNWVELLTSAEFAHNVREHAATGRAPFEALMGYFPKGHEDTRLGTTVKSVDDRMHMLQEVRKELHASQRVAAELMRWQRNHGTQADPYEVGQMVWLEGKNLHTTHPSHKLAPKRWGPFRVVAKINPVTYQLELPNT